MKVIVTGATGMIGEGVLQECLLDDGITAVLSVSRRPCEVKHQKLSEVLLPDFFGLDGFGAQLSDYDACLFCLGVSSIGMKETEYFKYTHTLTTGFAQILASRNPGMVFCYISGAKTDSSEKGNMMWARVKGKTENDLQQLPFKAVYNFRPGFLKPMRGMKRTLNAYKYMGWLYPMVRMLFPGSASTLKELAIAMIRVAGDGYLKKTLEVKDIIAVAQRGPG